MILQILENCEVSHILYTEEANIFLSGKGRIELVNKINKTFNKSSIHITSNRLKLNVLKTKFMYLQII